MTILEKVSIAINLEIAQDAMMQAHPQIGWLMGQPYYFLLWF